MQFDGPFGATKFGPIKQGDTQIDDRGVQTDQFVFKPELFLSDHLAVTLSKKLEKDLLIKLPGAVLIGISKSGTIGGGDCQRL